MLRFLDDEITTESLVMGILGSIISVSLNLTPAYLFYQYFKGERQLKEIPEMMFVSGVFCSSTNLAYAFIINDPIMIISNSICDSLQVIYSTIFLFFYSNKKISQFLLYLLIAYDLTFEIIFFFADVIEYHSSNEVAMNITGGFNGFIGIINVIAPGQNIIKVFKTENFTLIPILTIIVQCFCSTFWGIYGLFKLDIWICLPNLLGTILALVQIVTYYYFYCKRNGVPPERKEETDEENNNGNENENDEDNNIDSENKKNLLESNISNI